MKNYLYTSMTVVAIAALLGVTNNALAAASQAAGHSPLDNFVAHPPIHVKGPVTPDKSSHGGGGGGQGGGPGKGGGGGGGITNPTPTGLSPAQVRAAYNLPANGGAGATIAIVDAYDAPNIEADLATFSTQYGLPQCTSSTGCFTKHKMIGRLKADQGWGLEASLDTQWAHAIAPNANILFVEAKSASGNDLLNAVNWARSQPGVVAVSLSWGGAEFSGEDAYDSYFTGPQFFVSSGDSGAGVQWPAVSQNVISVGGTTLNLNTDGSVASETAWGGSGGGLSAYEPAGSAQLAYGVAQANGMRAVPDVAYNADPQSGVSIYDSYGYNGQSGWFTVGGTSAGAPQWAAIYALGSSATAANLYTDAASTNYSLDFRDILSGTNGTCGFFCTAGTAYDYVTGLGSPLTFSF